MEKLKPEASLKFRILRKEAIIEHNSVIPY